ncbi:MAG: oligosaccharide flippase family protein [Geodermatophilaceae bacterium]|nr:oligosaccharide flippase family protein [Geodermatophilaceae bacterium]
MVMVIAGSALLRPLQVVDAWFIMNQDSRRVVIIRVAVLFVLAAFRISLPLLGYGVVAVAWTYMIEAFLASVGSYIAYRRYNKGYEWVVSRARVASVAREFVPLLLMSSTALIYQRLGQVMLAWLSDLDQVGIYAASASLVDAPKFPLIALAVSATPRLLALKQTDPVRFREALQDFARFVNLFGYAVTIGLVVVFAPLAPLILGKAYADATVVIIILGVSTPLIALGASLQLLTNWEKLYRQAVVRNLSGALISVALNFALMPRYGAVGGAISTFCALLWVYVIGVALDKKTRFIFDITLPTLEPIGSTKVLLARRRKRKEEQALLREMNDFYSA